MSGAACMAELQQRLAAEGPASDSEAVTAPAASPAAPHRLARLRELLRRSDTPSPRDSSGPLQDVLADESESLLLADIDVDASSMHDLAVLRSVAARDCLADEDRPDSRLFLEPVRLAEGAGSAAAGDAPAPADGRWSPRAELQLEARQISSMRSITVLATAWLLASAALAQTGGSRIPSFEAIALTGEAVSSATLVGQPTLLIVTPSEGAAADTRMWVQGLGEHIDPKAIRIRAVLAVDVPFYMSEADVIGRTK